ncbi:YcxB family protein [Aeoliella sp. SH292]|uniref:YcxB family protein n=1 Tax=Aeoliella sp. SH292 TaxID=3454464 RepID=UPI003F9CEEB6
MSTDNPYASPSGERTAPIIAPHLEPPQSVSFQPSLQDQMEVFDHIARVHETWRQYFRHRQKTTFAVAAGAAGVSIVIAIADTVWNPFCGVAALGAVAIGIAALWLPAHLMRRHREKYRVQLAPLSDTYLSFVLTTALLPEGFQASDERGHSFRKWKFVPKVEKIEGLLLVYFEDASPYAIPERAFFNEAAFEGYAALAKRLWSAAHIEPVGESGELNV